jgi:hypothetical protein
MRSRRAWSGISGRGEIPDEHAQSAENRLSRLTNRRIVAPHGAQPR